MSQTIPLVKASSSSALQRFEDAPAASSSEVQAWSSLFERILPVATSRSIPATTPDSVSILPGGEVRYRQWSERFASVWELLSVRSAHAGAVIDVDEETRKDSEHALFLIYSFGAPPPQVFSHGGDAVVFKWRGGGVSRYLTISYGDAALVDINESNRVACNHEIVSLRSNKISDQMKYLGINYQEY